METAAARCRERIITEKRAPREKGGKRKRNQFTIVCYYLLIDGDNGERYIPLRYCCVLFSPHTKAVVVILRVAGEEEKRK